MIQSYPDYSKSPESRWFSELPSHWQSLKAKWVFSNQKHRASEFDEQLAASQKYGVVPQKMMIEMNNANVMLALKGTENFKQVIKNDFVISLRSFEGGIEHSAYDGCISPAYTVLRLRDAEIEPVYFKYALKCPPFIAALNSTSEGIRDGKTITYDEFGELLIALPPVHEQIAISAFLNSEISRLDSLIFEKQNFITLLKEKRQALIHDAICNQETFQIRLKFCVDKTQYPIPRNNYDEYQAIGLYNRGRGIFAKEPKLGKDLGDSDFFWIQPGDLILSGQFAWEGSVAIITKEFEGMVASHRYHSYRGKENVINTDYLWAYLTTIEGDFLLNECSRGAAGRNRPLNSRLLENEKIPVPPMNLQLEIARLVEIERKIGKESKKFEMLLKEHRTALISAAVTGKIDVRDMAINNKDAS